MATNRLTRRQFVVALTLPALLRTSGVGALLDGSTEIAVTFKAAATMSAQNVGTNTFMPFHPGAVRAFRERGVPLLGAALSRLDEIRTQGRIHGTAASARVMDSQATAAR
jgi:hypothetical protein